MLLHHISCKGHKSEQRSNRNCLTNHKKSKSYHLLFIALAVDTHTHLHFKKPGACCGRHAPGLKMLEADNNEITNRLGNILCHNLCKLYNIHCILLTCRYIPMLYFTFDTNLLNYSYKTVYIYGNVMVRICEINTTQ